MIVHLFEDEKFVDATINSFEQVSPKKNRYIVFSDTDSLKYVININQVEIFPNLCKKKYINKILEDCSLLIIHYLSPIKLFVLKNMPQNIPVIWSVWGGDAYSYFDNQNIYEPLTDKAKRKSVKEFIKSTFLYDIYHFYRYKVLPINKEIEALKKINYLITVLPYEYELIKKEFQLRAKSIDYNYGVDKFNKKGFSELGDGVLLGNSTTYSNNHLDIFELIKQNDKRIILPLSYGGNKAYKDIVIKEGRKIFKELFHPIEAFMPLEKYNQLILSCNSMIMYHIRQQALGNIYMALYLGMRVFLNKKSITYKYMKDVGMIIFELESAATLVGVELEQQNKVINRELVTKLQGEKAIINKTQGIYNLYRNLQS